MSTLATMKPQPVVRPFAQHVSARRPEGNGRAFCKLVVAVLYVVAGIYFSLQPFLTAVALTFALAVFFMIQEVLELTEYFIRKEQKSSWVLINGVIWIILCGMIWQYRPSGSFRALGQLVGIGMLVTGVTGLMKAIGMRKGTAELRNTHAPEVQAA